MGVCRSLILNKQQNGQNFFSRSFRNGLFAGNSRIRSFLKDGGGGLLRILLDNYPGKATEVFKYLKLAGYEEGEMMELVDREEGKTEETEFLYQSPLGRKFLKEKKQKK